jgi:uncharacterized membrane protein YfcA
VPEPWLELFVTGAAFLAGLVDAVVGGGGLIQLPALLVAFPAAAPMQLLATNKLSSMAGTLTASITWYRRVGPDLRTAVPLAVAAFAGSLAGAATASLVPRSAFDPIVLVARVVVGTIVIARPDLGLASGLRYRGRRHYLAAVLLGAGIGFYDGAMGPGTGTFLVFGLVGWLGYGFLEASAKARIANLMTNLAALVVFVPQGAVMWRTGLLMAAANVTGGYLGSRIALARGARFIRVVLVLVVGALAVKIAAGLWWPAG